MPKILGLREQVRKVYPSHEIDPGLRAAVADERTSPGLHETDGGRLLVRRQARLFVASRLLAAVPGVLTDLVRRLGTAVEVRPTDHARRCCRAAVLLADELIRINDRLPSPTPAEEVGRPETCEQCECGE